MKILYTFLAIFIYISCFFGYNLFFTTKNKTYFCTKNNISEENGFNTKLDFEMLVDETGSIIKGVNIISYVFSNKDVYNSSKEYYKKNPSDMEKYEFDDQTNTIKVISNENVTVIDPENNKTIEIWYKNYLANMTSMGYTCEEK